MSARSRSGTEASDARRRLEEAVPELSPFLFGWAHLRLARFPASRLAAEDVVQETWVRAFSTCAAAAARLPAPEGLRPWLVGIARNVILEDVRQPAGREASPERSTVLGGLRDTVTSLCTQLARHELVRSFLAFAEGLEEVDRQLLVRCGFEDGHPSEVALPLGLDPDSAARRWHRLRERLREARWDERWGLGA
jgi:RNA polymerase sigma factor (sigma-70 family)